jgi:elongation factor 1-alpha
LGIKNYIVAVNKMDYWSVNYSEERFNEIWQEIRVYMDKIGWQVEGVEFIPVSALNGENLTTRSEKHGWYTGPTLVEALDSLSPVEWALHKPLRFCLKDTFRIWGVGSVYGGNVSTGIILPEMKLISSPGWFECDVISLQIQHN